MARLADGTFNVLVNGVGASTLLPRRVRRVLLGMMGIRIGHSAVEHSCFFGSPRITIGDATFINVGVFLDGLGSITIGSNVHLAMRSVVLTGSHEIGGPERRGGTLTAAEVVIGDGVWVGAGAIILPGVTIGKGSVIAAGSVVTSSCEPQSVYAGVPARLVRHLDEQP